MKKIVFLVLFVVVLFQFLPIPLPGELGKFNTITGFCWCLDDGTCLHEGAHKMDRALGWVSSSKAFREAVHNFMLIKMADTNSPSAQGWNIRVFLRTYRLERAQELYADLFMWAGGEENKMPPAFRGFYDWRHSLDYARACWLINE